MLQKLCTRLQVGRVNQTVQALKKEKKQAQKETKKPLFYAEATRKGVTICTPGAPQGAAVWSATRTFFLRLEHDTV